uniref:TctD transcriptional regulator n=1 Tax=Gracilaria tenuistipitata var. liui TaxID=285951 RepID=Q6B901_GRATL|nr:tctD transcriptional regulator [Gracilaria tenuistipitata var. liui]AAT79634.1 tctD transcriptional regulator [Gracilaria tenuistipitata var. liui]
MKKKILLIDDDINLLNSMASYLISEGFTIDITTNGDKVLKNLNIIKPDLIITDIMMPDISGYDLIKQIRSNEKWCHTPVIFLTAKGMTHDRILGYELGCNAYIAKPFYPEELISIINNIFKYLETWKQHTNSNIQKLNNEKQNSIFNSLTSREYSILVLVSKGCTNKEIANTLNLSTRNIEKYVSRLLSKTKTRNRTELAKLTLLNALYLEQGE